MPSKIKPEIEKYIIELYSANIQSGKIAKKVGCSKGGVLRVVKDAGILKTSQEGSRLYGLDEHIFDQIDTEEKAYWLGFITADGYVGVYKYRKILGMMLSKRDTPHLNKFRTFLKTDRPILFNTQKSKWRGTLNKETHTCSIQINNTKIVDKLISYGLVPRKSLILKPWAGQSNLMKHYWRGYFDGDGSICRYIINSNKYIVWTLDCLGTEEMMNSFNNFLKNTLKIETNSVRKHKNIFKVSYSSRQDVLSILKLFYENSSIWLDRKYNKALEGIAELETSLTPSRSCCKL